MKEIKPIYKGNYYAGERFGEWEVLNEGVYIPTKHGGQYKWLCKCSCGLTKLVGITSLLYGRTTKCISCANSDKNKALEQNSNWKGFGDIPGEVLQKIRQNAKRRSREIPVEVDCAYLDKIWKEQQGKCAYTGRKLTILKDASVDRIDSNKGYIKDNVEWVHKDVNKAKMALSKNDFLTLIKDIYDFTCSN
jgi:hypothetical protein